MEDVRGAIRENRNKSLSQGLRRKKPLWMCSILVALVAFILVAILQNTTLQ